MFWPTFLRCTHFSSFLSHLKWNGAKLFLGGLSWMLHRVVNLGRREEDDDNHNVTVRVVGNFSFQSSSSTISHHFNIQKMSSIFFSFVFFSLCLCIFIGNLISLFSLLVMLHLTSSRMGHGRVWQDVKGNFSCFSGSAVKTRKKKRKGEWNERIYQIRI